MAEPDVSEQAGVREQAEDSEPPDGAGPADGADPADRRRTQLIAAAQARWVAALTDLGGRNTLLYYKDRRAGTLDLAAADPAALDKFLRTGSARLTRLFHDVDARADAIRRVQVIYRKARELLEERGIRAGYLAAGLARWDELFLEPAGRPAARPDHHAYPGPARRLRAVLYDDYEVNPVLLYKLASVFGAATEELAERAGRARWGRLLRRAAEAAEVPGFEITDRRVIGTFTYAKLPMVRDLQAANELLNDSDVVAAIAGDPEAQESLGAADPVIGAGPDAPLLDSPEDDFSVLDADSSQRGAIGAVLAGRSLVIHGPPGTGKSQTIANLIATLVARGRKVLFVAEKRAAIDAVLSRLKGVGLGGMVLDIHEGTRDRLRIARDLGDTLDRGAAHPGAGPDRPAPPPGGPAGPAQPARDRAARGAQAVGATGTAEPPGEELPGALRAAASELAEWRELSTGTGLPRLPDGYPELAELGAHCAAQLGLLGGYVALAEDPAAQLAELAADQDTAWQLPRLYQLEAGFAELGLGQLLDELARREAGPEAGRGRVRLRVVLGHPGPDAGQRPGLRRAPRHGAG